MAGIGQGERQIVLETAEVGDRGPPVDAQADPLILQVSGVAGGAGEAELVLIAHRVLACRRAGESHRQAVRVAVKQCRVVGAGGAVLAAPAVAVACGIVSGKPLDAGDEAIAGQVCGIAEQGRVAEQPQGGLLQGQEPVVGNQYAGGALGGMMEPEPILRIPVLGQPSGLADRVVFR